MKKEKTAQMKLKSLLHLNSDSKEDSHQVAPPEPDPSSQPEKSEVKPKEKVPFRGRPVEELSYDEKVQKGAGKSLLHICCYVAK